MDKNLNFKLAIFTDRQSIILTFKFVWQIYKNVFFRQEIAMQI